MRYSRTRKKKTVKRRSPRYSTLTERERAAYERTAKLISELRRGEGSYAELLRKYHLNTRTARRYAGLNLLGGTRGKPVRASKADRMIRDLTFPMPIGDVPIRIRNSRDATRLSEYFRDRDKLLRGKMSGEKFEAKWRGEQIAGEVIFADAGEILRRAEAHDLTVEDLYASVISTE
jgi:hypothetical protein